MQECGKDGHVDVGSGPHLVEIVAALKEITARLSSASALPEAVDDLIKVATDLLPTDTVCGVTLISQGEPATFAATGLSAEVVDEVRQAGGEGPGMDAVRSRDIVLSQCLDDEARWPAWTATARRHGVRGVLAYPFDVDELTLGAFTLYAGRCQAFTGEVPILAMLVADHASLLLRVRLRQLGEGERLARVEEHTGGDATIERAIGIVMAQRGCPPEKALRHLHDAATHLGVGLSAVAERLVRSVADRGAAL
jgi:transcriptional regulator with GAF, ATPase, and Fis domain